MTGRLPPARFGAVITAMVTPFGPEGGLDVDGAVALARWLVANGSDGLVVTGTTGEGPVLDDAEKLELWRAVAEAVRVPVIAGTGTADTRHSVELTRQATSLGVAGVLVVTPYYNRPSQAGIFAHFAAVADATSLPVVLYDIPVRTGRKVAVETILRAAREVPNIVAVKDASGDFVAAAQLMAQVPQGFELYSGDDAATLPLLALGGVGVVSVASHWIGRAMGEMIAAFGRGEVDVARLTNAALLESYSFESTVEYPNPMPTKAVMRVLGLPGGQCRLPLGPAPAALDEQARQVLDRLGPLGAAPVPASAGQRLG